MLGSAGAVLRSAAASDDRSVKQKSFYNLNYQLLISLGGLMTSDSTEAILIEAVDAGREALRLDPTDDDARWNLAVAGAVALAAAFVLCGLASRSWVKPILELRSAAETIGAGDLSVEIASERRDEIGDVVRAFGAMLRGLRSTVGEVIHAADGVESTAGRIAQATRRLVDVAAAQARGNAEAASALERIDAQVAGIAASAAQSERTLDLAVDGSSSSMRELSRSGDSLEESARELWDQTEAVGDSIERMITGALEVAEPGDGPAPIP